MQVAFIVAAGVIALIAAVAFAWVARTNLKRNLTALGGIVLLLAFVVVRASSFHHVDVFINSTLAGVRWNAIMELGGIGLTARRRVQRDAVGRGTAGEATLTRGGRNGRDDPVVLS